MKDNTILIVLLAGGAALAYMMYSKQSSPSSDLAVGKTGTPSTVPPSGLSGFRSISVSEPSVSPQIAQVDNSIASYINAAAAGVNALGSLFSTGAGIFGGGGGGSSGNPYETYLWN